MIKRWIILRTPIDENDVLKKTLFSWTSLRTKIGVEENFFKI